MRFSAPYGHYYFKDFKVDVFGWNAEKARYVYSVETPYSSKVREATCRYRRGTSSPEPYIYIIDPQGKKRKLFLD